MSEERKYEGLGGWLTIWLVLAFLGLARKILHIDIHLISGESWQAGTNPGSDLYHPLWKPLLIYEFVLQFAETLLWVVLIVFFFSKRKFFPRLAIICIALHVSFILLDTLAAFYLSIELNLKRGAMGRELLGSLIGACVWIPYFLKSDRVKATFVR
jgi:hypothetical protein